MIPFMCDISGKVILTNWWNLIAVSGSSLTQIFEDDKLLKSVESLGLWIEAYETKAVKLS